MLYGVCPVVEFGLRLMTLFALMRKGVQISLPGVDNLE